MQSLGPAKRIRLMVWGILLIFDSLVLAAAEPPWEVGEFAPAWADLTPKRTLQFSYESSMSEQANGSSLADTISRLKPGDRLLIAPGRYSIDKKFNIELSGEKDAPIWIEGEEGKEQPIITRPDARQNVINLGERSKVQYLCLRGLELTGGSTLIRFYNCHHVWLDRCHLHHSAAEGITANTRDTSNLFITHNHVHHFENESATGEAMYLGANQGKVAMSYSVIALNHVHHCGSKQGDGIEVKQGSHHNWIVRNLVHDTKYPCILVYGTGGQGINLIEQNTCYRSQDNVMQVQGEAVVRNNLLIDGQAAGFASTDQQGKTRNLKVTQNTIISRRRGANLSSWNGRDEMVFANNAVYTAGGEAVRFPNGFEKVKLVGNVILGSASIVSSNSGATDGFRRGRGLGDFLDVSWDGAKRNASPATNSPLIGFGDKQYAASKDITGKARGPKMTVGAFDQTNNQ